jgi:CDP-diglyceride synthetase
MILGVILGVVIGTLVFFISSETGGLSLERWGRAVIISMCTFELFLCVFAIMQVIAKLYSMFMQRRKKEKDFTKWLEVTK